MSTITTRVEGASRFPWRTVGVMALLVLVLAVAAVLVVGSRAKPLPAPFGPAENGRITYSVNGDIVAADSPPSTPRTIIGGAPFGSGAVVLARRYPPRVHPRPDERSRGDLDAEADGSNARRLASTPRIGGRNGRPGRRRRGVP